MSDKVTFGCGEFLPGLGPGNIPEFDGGGTIDAGGGDDTTTVTPTDPKAPIDPVQPPGDGGGPGGGGLGGPSGESPTDPQGPATPGPGGPAPPGGGGGGPSTPGPQGPAPPTISTNGGGGGGIIFVDGSVTDQDLAPPTITTIDGGGAGDGAGDGAGGGGNGTPTLDSGSISTGGALFDAGSNVRTNTSFRDQPGSEDQAGNGLVRSESLDGNFIINNAISTGEINLNDPTLAAAILRKNPYGVQDSTIAVLTTPEAPDLVPNDSGFREFFRNNIDSNLHYVLKNRRNPGNWDSRKAFGITPAVIYENLNSEVRDILDKIKNYDGTKLSINQIFNLIGSRVLDGTLSTLSKKDLISLAENSIKQNPVVIKPSTIPRVNEIAVLSLIDKNKFSVDKNKLSGRDKEIIKNWKVLPSDVDMYIPVVIRGVEKKYYINDDGTFIDRVTLSLRDGDYFDITIGGKSERLYTKSEKDHAFVLPERTRQKAISLLGGQSGRTLEVSAPASVASGIEFESSLSAPRQAYYLLSCNLSSLYTRPSRSETFLLKDTTVEYKLMDTVTVEGRSEADEFIKYKANKRVFLIDDSDLLLDYVETTSSLNLTQTDILFDSPKENKSIPLLTRQIPWYIMLYPTNRTDYNLFNSKSKIEDISRDGSITRILRCRTSIVPEFSKSQTNKFIRYDVVDRDGVDVYGVKDTQARTTIINIQDRPFKQAYRDRGELKGTSDYTPKRKKTGFRLIREIINELDTNYELSINGIGKSLTEFDVFSRLTLEQFNKLSRLESFNTIKKAIQNGLINNVKIIPPVSRADKRISFNKTQLVQRKTTALPDTFRQIKATNTGLTIVSPNEDGVGGFVPYR